MSVEGARNVYVEWRCVCSSRVTIELVPLAEVEAAVTSIIEAHRPHCPGEKKAHGPAADAIFDAVQPPAGGKP